MLIPVIITALCIDYLFGEPRNYHPLVGFGALAKQLETLLNRNNHRFAKGLVALAVLLIPIALLISLMHQSIANTWFTQWLFETIVLYWAIGHRSLGEHVSAVKRALAAQNLPLARQRLSGIVSRSTAELDQTQVAQAAIETTLENGNDATFAPLFWYCCAGPVAVVMYRLINTLDAMWGYRNPRFELFGKAAARADDALNYVPARLVAISYALLGNAALSFQCWQQQAPLLNSPNAGPVMSAGAGSLDLRLGGPARYNGETVPKPYFGGNKNPDHHDIETTIELVHHALVVWVLLIAVIRIF